MNKLAYTVPEFSELCGFSVRHFYALMKRGDGPRVTHVGRRTLIRHETGEAWLQEREADIAA